MNKKSVQGKTYPLLEDTRIDARTPSVAGREPVNMLLQRSVRDLLDYVTQLPYGQLTVIEYKGRSVLVIVQESING